MKKISVGVLVIAVLSFLFVAGFWVWTFNEWENQVPQTTRTYGDLFDGLNAFFSGLAFAGIIVTIILQSKELALQRQELSETKAELKRSATAQENSENALKRQAENLKQSARLSALSTLLNYYTEKEKGNLSGHIDGMRMDIINQKRLKYIEQIEEILEGKSIPGILG